MIEGDVVVIKETGERVVVVDALSSQLYVKNEEDGKEYFVFLSEVKRELQ